MIVDLKTHPTEEASFIDKASVELNLEANTLTLSYRFLGEINLLEIDRAKEGQEARRTDNLWKQTCCELFIGQTANSNYLEFNFAPNGNWSAYSFSSYRKDRCDLQINAIPLIGSVWSKDEFRLNVSMNITEWHSILYSGSADNESNLIQMGICAITRSNNGNQMHWALHHPRPRPDFHDSNSFALALNLNSNVKDH
jgi:hypothetical protein